MDPTVSAVFAFIKNEPVAKLIVQDAKCAAKLDHVISFITRPEIYYIHDTETQNGRLNFFMDDLTLKSRLKWTDTREPLLVAAFGRMWPTKVSMENESVSLQATIECFTDQIDQAFPRQTMPAVFTVSEDMRRLNEDCGRSWTILQEEELSEF